MSNTPLVLVIDDEPEKVALDLSRDDIKIRVRHPTLVGEDDLVAAHLVLIDHVLEHTTWDPEPPFACWPSDGVGLAGLVRAHLRRLKCPPAAVALYSGALNELAPTGEMQEHLIAMAFGLEWAFAKDRRTDAPDLDTQVGSLAKAVAQLPRSWSQEDPDKLAQQLQGVLGLKESWSVRAYGDVERCRPPMHQLSEWTSGIAVLRWLLHRVLPYPCLLLGVPDLAVRLRVRLNWLQENLKPGRALREAVEGTRYKGALHDFLGDRWWWAGWDAIMSKESSSSIRLMHQWLSDTAGSKVDALEIEQPVLTFDEDGTFRSIESKKHCVRIQPDNWPSYADEPWCKESDARQEPRLKRLVVSDDLDVFDAKPGSPA